MKNKNGTKPGKARKSTDDLQFRSAKVFPNFKPRVAAEVEPLVVGDSEINKVTWELDRDEIVLNKKYSFTIKLKVGPNVDSDDLPFVSWIIEDTSDVKVGNSEKTVGFVVK